jgi:hypothetical protein
MKVFYVLVGVFLEAVVQAVTVVVGVVEVFPLQVGNKELGHLFYVSLIGRLFFAKMYSFI